jgi:hypothetical protein
VGPATLFVAPVTVRALERAGETRLARFSRPASRRESRILAGFLAAVVVAGAVAMGAVLRAMDPLENAPALRIARHLAAQPGTLRVWDGYNASGVLVAFGGGTTGNLKLVVDGRADLWGGDYIQHTVRTQSIAGDWRQHFSSFGAQAMVMPEDTPIVHYLEEVDHWSVAQVDGDYVLLVPPGSPLLAAR